jgi:2-methylisocitrate lyase-like PEP mutase family enzyme
MGYRLAIFPSELQRAALYAMYACGRHLQATGSVEGFDLAASFQEREAAVDAAAWHELSQRYATTAMDR